MKEATADLWGFPAQYLVVTTNGILNSKNELVMGAGVAMEAKCRFPGLPKKLGRYVQKYGSRVFVCKEEGIITFPTKVHWKDLVKLVDKFDIRSVAMPRPGCSNGGLTWDFVKPYIDDILDDRFTVVHK